jgi:predicted ATPase
MEEYLAFCQEQGFHYWIPPAMLVSGWARGVLAPDAAALEALRESLALWQRCGASIAGPQHFGMLAELAGKLGHFEEAFTATATGREFVQRFGEQVYAPHLGIIEGALWQQRADFTRAEQCFRESLALARQCGARWHELRARLSLARLLHSLMRSEEARKELAPAVAWFTEGAELLSLREARSLLDELG